MRKEPEGSFEANPQTQALRPQHGLTNQQVESIRNARREGRSLDEISETYAIDLETIKIVAAGLRTEREDPGRYTLNVTEAAYNIVMSQKLPNEAVWQTMNRILGVN